MATKKSAEEIRDELERSFIENAPLSQSREEIETPASFEEILALASEMIGQADLAYIGSAYLSADKSELVKQPFIIREWKFADGDYSPFVIVKALTQDDRMVIFTDGGAGIFRQLEQVTDHRSARGLPAREMLLCPNGLRVSEYTVGDDGKPLKRGESGRPARTYYIA